MHRVLAVFLIIVMIFGFACAETSAYEIALGLAEAIDQMSDVRQAPLDDLKNRAVWKDSRANAKCALAVYPNVEAAKEAELSSATRDTSVYALDTCVLYLDSDMGMDAIRDYQLALAEKLGKELNDAEPDYILNVNTKKFHQPGCSSVDDMKDTNKQYFTGNREDIIDQGYTPCKRCKP